MVSLYHFAYSPAFWLVDIHFFCRLSKTDEGIKSAKPTSKNLQKALLCDKINKLHKNGAKMPKNPLTKPWGMWYDCLTSKRVIFLCPKMNHPPTNRRVFPRQVGDSSVSFTREAKKSVLSGGADMRIKITLACTECKQRNYNTKKNKKNDPDRLEMNKYCKFCRKHTLHKETK